MLEFLGSVQSQSSLAHPSPAAEQWQERGRVLLIVLFDETRSNLPGNVHFSLSAKYCMVVLSNWVIVRNWSSSTCGFVTIENRLLCSFDRFDDMFFTFLQRTKPSRVSGGQLCCTLLYANALNLFKVPLDAACLCELANLCNTTALDARYNSRSHV